MAEIAPGFDLQRDILDQAATPLRVAANLKTMGGRLFAEPIFGLVL